MGTDITTNVVTSLETTGMFTTVKGTDIDSRKAVFTAVNSAEQITKVLESTKGPLLLKIKDIVVQSVEVVNETSGEVETAPRVIFLTDDDKAYAGTSIGLLSSVKNIITILGEPDTWESPIIFQVVEKRSRKGFRFLSLEFA